MIPLKDKGAVFLLCFLLVSGLPSAAQEVAGESRPVSPALLEALGRRLFFDPRLSRDGTISCHTCHQLVDDGTGIPSGADAVPRAVGIGGREGRRNTPTLWNVVDRTALFWDGRAGDLEEQALGPLMNPKEMGNADARSVVENVWAVGAYDRAFADVFEQERRLAGRPPHITIDEICRALAAFQRTLRTGPAPFDRFRKGESGALSSSARRGWELFRNVGCITCHGGPTFLRKDNFARFPRRAEGADFDYLFGFSEDPGRFGVTGQGKDRQRWRVPSLRDAARTAPYFHNGQVQHLEHAIRVMGKAQLAREFSPDEVRDLAAFIRSLAGPVPRVVNPLTAGQDPRD